MKRILYGCVFFAVVFSLNAQHITSGENMFGVFSSAMEIGLRSKMSENFANGTGRGSEARYGEAGSPYIREHFVEGIIYFIDGGSVEVLLNYNMVTSAFEYKKDTLSQISIIGVSRTIKEIEWRNSRYRQIGNDFMQVVSESENYSLYLLVQKDFIPAEPAQAVRAAQPARFSATTRKYYLFNGMDGVFLTKNFSNLNEILDVSKSVIKSKKKEMDVDLKDASSVAAFIEAVFNAS